MNRTYDLNTFTLKRQYRIFDTKNSLKYSLLAMALRQFIGQANER